MEHEDKVEIDWQEKLAHLVMDEWSKGRQYVDELDDLYEDLYHMLRGERPEKNYDWQSNIVINKVFQVIWTAIPYITQKIFSADPIIGVESFDKKGKWQREEILQFWHTMQPATNTNHNPYFTVVVMWVLRALLNGVGILKKSWHQKLKVQLKQVQSVVPMNVDENGNVIDAEPVTTTKRTTIPIEDWPFNEVINNKDIVVDWMLQPGRSIRHGRFIIHRTISDVGEMFNSKIKYINLDQIEVERTTTTDYNQDHADVKQKDRQEEPPKMNFYSDIEKYERQGILPVYKDTGEPCFDMDFDDDDVIYREMIVTVAKVNGKNILVRYEKNPYEEKNYVDMHIYFDAERWQSMGLVEPFKDMQVALNDNINAMFDEIWSNLMPPTIVNKYALWDWDTMQYAPNQRWLVGGNPAESIYFKPATNITTDAWQNHLLFDSEIQLTSAVTPPMQGAGKEKAATTNVLNAQMSAGKLDFIIKMIEQTALIPSAQMDVRFAKKFAHPMTFMMILGEPFIYGDVEEFYKYVPAASSVKLEHQRNAEIQQDIQLIQIMSGIQNPKMPKIINMFLQNILRNRNAPKEAALLDEDFFEPQSDAGNVQMLDRMMGGASNQNNVSMSQPEQQTRESTYQPRGLPAPQ